MSFILNASDVTPLKSFAAKSSQKRAARAARKVLFSELFNIVLDTSYEVKNPQEIANKIYKSVILPLYLYAGLNPQELTPEYASHSRILVLESAPAWFTLKDAQDLLRIYSASEVLDILSLFMTTRIDKTYPYEYTGPYILGREKFTALLENHAKAPDLPLEWHSAIL